MNVFTAWHQAAQNPLALTTNSQILSSNYESDKIKYNNIVFL